MGNLDKIWTQMGTFVVAVLRELLGIAFTAGYYFAQKEIGKPVAEDLKEATNVRLLQELEESGIGDQVMYRLWSVLPDVMRDAEDSCNQGELNDLMIVAGDSKKTAH